MTVLTQRVVALDELASLVNERLGVSRWHVITQEQINLFAQATGDPPSALESLCYGPPPPTDTALVELATGLTDLERKLTTRE